MNDRRSISAAGTPSASFSTTHATRTDRDVVDEVFALQGSHVSSGTAQ